MSEHHFNAFASNRYRAEAEEIRGALERGYCDEALASVDDESLNEAAIAGTPQKASKNAERYEWTFWY